MKSKEILGLFLFLNSFVLANYNAEWPVITLTSTASWHDEDGLQSRPQVSCLNAVQYEEAEAKE